jgi:hypothetical protein
VFFRVVAPCRLAVLDRDLQASPHDVTTQNNDIVVIQKAGIRFSGMGYNILKFPSVYPTNIRINAKRKNPDSFLSYHLQPIIQNYNI